MHKTATCGCEAARPYAGRDGQRCAGVGMGALIPAEKGVTFVNLPAELFCVALGLVLLSSLSVDWRYG